MIHQLTSIRAQLLDTGASIRLQKASLLVKKQERVQWRHYQIRYEAQQDKLQYISMFHNSYRLHSYPGYKNPNQYEAEAAEIIKVT